MSKPIYKSPWFWLVVAAGGAAMSERVRFFAVDAIQRGSRLTRSRWYKGDSKYGFMHQLPEELRWQASQKIGFDIPLEAYSLARMLRSEGAKEGTLRAHVAMNDLKRFRWANTLHDLLTYSTDKSRRGFYGRQFSRAVPPEFPKANRRRYATKRDPYEGDVKLAMAMIDERARGIDRANGATKFLDRSAMGRQIGSVSFEKKDAQWRADGYTPFTVPEFGTDLVLYRRG